MDFGGPSWFRGRSSVGRAREWHSRGQGFDPPRLHSLGPVRARQDDGSWWVSGRCAAAERTLNSNPLAGIAQLVEHNLAKVGVAGSSPVSRSALGSLEQWLGSRRNGRRQPAHVAGWSSLVARRAHNPEVVGSNPTPAIGRRKAESRKGGNSAPHREASRAPSQSPPNRPSAFPSVGRLAQLVRAPR